MIPTTFAVLRNTGFRRLWLAQAVSLAGDWFTLIALSVAVSRESQGSGLAVAGLLLTQLLPSAFIGPMSGVLADRFDRRHLLIGSDLIRAVIVLSFIPAVNGGHLKAVYALALLHFTVATVFEPARSALVPHLVSPAQLVAASTLSSTTWSAMAALGGLAGGAVLAKLGVTFAFAIDAVSFVASACLIGLVKAEPRKIPERADHREGGSLVDGLRYVMTHPVTGASLLVKPISGIAIVDTFLVVYATRLFPVGDGGAFSLGMLWASFGLGAILGPVLLNLANDGSVRRMRRLIVAGCGLISGGLLMLAWAPTLAVTSLAILLRGAGGSTNWTYSTVILQTIVPDPLRGRLFALELAGTTLAAAVATLAWGAAMDGWGVRPAVTVAATVSALLLLAWLLSLPWMERREGA